MPILSAGQLAAARKVFQMQGPSRLRVQRVTGRRNRMLALALWHAAEGRCRRCGLPIDPTLDYRRPGALTIGHRIPIAKGGTNDPRNLAAEHRRCNLEAGARDERPVSVIVLP